MTIRFHAVPLIVAIGGLTLSTQVYAMDAGTLSQEIEKTLPSLETQKQREKGLLDRKEQGMRPISGFFRDLPQDQKLVVAIEEIYLESSLLHNEILSLAEERLRSRKEIKKEDFAHLRQDIWDLGLRHKKLLYSTFRVIPGTASHKASVANIKVMPIAIRNVRVVPDPSVRPSLLATFEAEARDEFAGNKPLDLEELDNALKHRLRLGDVSLHASVVPVDETHIDLEFSVSLVPDVDPEYLLQYDNAGGWSFGRDRMIGGASFKSALTPGDSLDLMAMKSADMGHTDFNHGMYFGRMEYSVPIGEWGVRWSTWISGLHYREAQYVLNNRASNGEALELGQGISRPIYTDRQTIVDLSADFTAKYAIDRAFETTRLDEKVEYAGKLKASILRRVAENQVLQANVAIKQGTVDLSPHRGDYEQDQSGPKQNGLFTKIEPSVSWFGNIDREKITDFRFDFKGQWTPKNLDSAEQFSLGGMTGLRAFGSGEASGDIGWMLNGNIGYKIDEGFRVYVLYDVGEIRKSARTWVSQGKPYSYVLQDAGFGLSKNLGPTDLGLTFARQIGPNPGVTSGGLDVDNTNQRYRLWASASVRF